jgi:hypothetical protein
MLVEFKAVNNSKRLHKFFVNFFHVALMRRTFYVRISDKFCG